MTQQESNFDREQFERDLERTLREAGADRLPPPPPPRRRSSPALDLRPRSPGQVMIAGGILLLLEWFGLAFFLGGLAGTLGVGLLLFGLVSWLIRPRRRETYWRGRRIDLEEGASWREQVYHLFYRR